MSLIKSHSYIYSCPNNINYLWNIGFILFVTITFQILVGLLLAIFYTSDIKHSFYTIMYSYKDNNYGWYLRYGQSIG